MGLPKKNNIKIYTEKEILDRRQELLERITKSDAYMPDSILHDDLDMGMLEFVKMNLKTISDGEQIPIIPKILTVQRWGEITSTWTFSDEDGNMKVPFIGVVRKPDVQPGTNPVIQRTIPDRRPFFYASVPTWNGTQLGADIYKMPQPVAVDIGFEVTIVCQKFRDLNKFNKIILQKFSSRQAYTSVKGHYIPIILETITDQSPIDSLESRRYYLQTYQFLMLGFLIDSDEFEVKPAVNRLLLMTEFMSTKNYSKRFLNKSIETKNVTFIADGQTTVFSVGEIIGFLFFVSVNGIIEERDVGYYWIGQTSRVIFVEAPVAGSVIMVSYYAGRSNVFQDAYGKLLFLETENFDYIGPTIYGGSATFTVQHEINSIIYVDINGLVDEEGDGFAVTASNQVTILPTPTHPLIGPSKIGITYLR